MFKKFLSVLLAVMMVVSVLATSVVTTGAVTTDGFTPEPNKFYFDIDGTGWTLAAKDKIAFYFAGGDFDTEANSTKPLDWGNKSLIGSATAGETGIFEIDPAAINDGNGNPYQLTPGVQYKIIFCHIKAPRTWTNSQTGSLYFTTDCLGHVAYCDGTEMENDVDSTKTSLAAFWRGIDPAENGPALCITSIGNVVGSCIEQGKTVEGLFVDFLTEVKFSGKTGLENARKFVVDVDPSSPKYKSEQKLIDDIGEALGLTKDQIKTMFEENTMTKGEKNPKFGEVGEAEYSVEPAEITTTWSYDASTLPAASAPHVHTPGEPVEENLVPATCKAAGSHDMVVYCTECGEELSRETSTITKLEHTPGEPVQENVVPADCQHAGSYDKVVYCTKCGDEISREEIVIGKLLHTPADPVIENATAPGCETAGSHDEVVYCSVCEEELSRETVTDDPTGHDDPLTFVEEVPATASKDGVAAHYLCTKCGKKFADSTGATEVTDEQLVIKAAHTRGDADGNGTFDSIDVTTIQRKLVEIPVTENYDEIAADADLDGIVDIIDVTLMQRVLAKMITFEEWDAKHALS